MKIRTVFILSVATLLLFMIAAVPGVSGKQKAHSNEPQTIDDGMLYGCYKKVNGQLRLVSSPDYCRPSEEPISWNAGGQAEAGIDLSVTVYIVYWQKALRFHFH